MVAASLSKASRVGFAVGRSLITIGGGGELECFLDYDTGTGASRALPVLVRSDSRVR